MKELLRNFIVVMSVFMAMLMYIFLPIHTKKTFYVKEVDIYMTIERLKPSFYKLYYSKDKDKPGKDFIYFYNFASDMGGITSSFKTGNNDTIYIDYDSNGIIRISETVYKFKLSKGKDRDQCPITVSMYPMDNLTVWRGSVYLCNAEQVK